MTPRSKYLWLLLPGLMAASSTAFAAGRAPVAPKVAPKVATVVLPDTQSIVAIVNGDVITQGDVDARARLFALSANIPLSADELTRLDAQISQQLIDEKLRLQEAQTRKIAVPDADIAAQIDDLNKRNGGNLAKSLAADGISMHTLVDQLRAQIAWSQVLRQEIGNAAQVSPAEIDARMAIEKANYGKEEYEVSEIFVPVATPSHADAAKRFADTVIERLRSGAAFANVAAEFSQSEDALQGGDLGWVFAADLDSDVADVVTKMPAGAVSNPIRVPGGYAIVSLVSKRIAGNDMVTMATIRQAFFPFTTNLNPAAPTEQQKDQLLKARALSASAHACPAIEAANAAAGSNRASNPGQLPIERLSNPAMKQILSSLAINQPTQPLVSSDGILVMMVCSKTQQNLAEVTRDDMGNRIVNERIERLARKLQRNLERQANIKRQGVAAENSDT